LMLLVWDHEGLTLAYLFSAPTIWSKLPANVRESQHIGYL